MLCGGFSPFWDEISPLATAECKKIPSADACILAFFLLP
jgi:hypothetical protein